MAVDRGALEQSDRGELRRHAAVGDEVEVKILRRGFAPIWKRGVITDLAGKGAFVCTGPQATDFYFWSSLRRISSQNPSKPTATLGEVVLHNQAKRSPAPPPEPPEPAPAPEPPPAPPVIDASHPILPPLATAIRMWRLSVNLTQTEAAELFDTDQSQFSRLELGKTVPNDDQLKTFAELSGSDIEELLDAAAVARFKRAVPARVQPAPPPPASAPPRTATSIEAPEDDYATWSLQVEAIAPVPTNRDARRRWFTLVRELFDLTRVK